MFSTLLAPPKKHSSDSAFAKFGISRTSFSSRRGSSATPAEPATSKNLRHTKTSVESRAKSGRHTKEKKLSLSPAAEPEKKIPPQRTASKHTAPKLKTRPSSPLLGERYYRTSQTSGSATHSKPHTLKASGSDSSLKSHYDAQKSPMSISQQTSASAVRDFHVKKGLAPIMSSSEQVFRPHRHLKSGLDDDQNFHGGKSIQNRKGDRNGQLTQRPRHIDLSSLFPKPAVTRGPLLSPHRYTHSPSPYSEASTDLTQLSETNPMQFGGLGKTLGPNQQHSQQREYILRKRTEPYASKTSSWKPTARIQNWFDGPEGNVSEDEETSFDFLSNRNPMTSDLPQENYRSQDDDRKVPYSVPFSSSQGPVAALGPPPVPRRSLSRSPGGLLTSEIEAFKFPAAPLFPPNSGYRRQIAMSMSSKRSKASTLEQANLMNESVLSMSSSEEDSDQELSMTPRSHSSMISSYVQGLSAQAARLKLEGIEPSMELSDAPLSRQHSRLVDSGRMSSLSLSRSPQILKRSSRADRSTSAGLNGLSKQDLESSTVHEQFQHSRKISVRASTDSHTSRKDFVASTGGRVLFTPKPGLPRKSSIRTMTVTREEEALLEAIRQKKALMKRDMRAEEASPNSELPYINDVVYSSDRERQRPGIELPQPPIGNTGQQGLDRSPSQNIGANEDQPLKTNLCLTSSEPSTPERGHPAQSYQSNMGQSILGPSPTTDSRDSGSPVTPPQPTLYEELPPERINSLRPLHPALQLTGTAQHRISNSGPMKCSGTQVEGDNQTEDLPGWTLRGIQTLVA